MFHVDVRFVRALLLGVVAAMVFVGCSGDRPEKSSETLPTDDIGESTETSIDGVELPADEEDVDLASDVDEPAGPARALITPTGVVVPVVGETDRYYLVTSPCGKQTRVVWGTPLSEIDVVLDPGHGGDVETGSVGANGLIEKELNLIVAKRTARILESRGYTVLLTRTADYRMPLSVRAEIANRLDAQLIVSIHHNAPNANTSDVPGTEVFVQPDSDESIRLGGLLHEEIVEALTPFDVDWTSATDAGTLVVLNGEGDSAYGMVRRPKVPAVLAELAYMSNEPEANLFETDAYRTAASNALADGIERWLSTDDEGSPLVEEPRIFSPSGLTGGTDGCVDPDLG